MSTRARHARAKANRGSLPAHLERVEQVVPTTFRVMVTRRPRYGCRACEAAPVQAPAPPHIVEAGLPTEALIAHMLVAKYADHLPLYR